MYNLQHEWDFTFDQISWIGSCPFFSKFSYTCLGGNFVSIPSILAITETEQPCVAIVLW